MVNCVGAPKAASSHSFLWTQAVAALQMPNNHNDDNKNNNNNNNNKNKNKNKHKSKSKNKKKNKNKHKSKSKNKKKNKNKKKKKNNNKKKKNKNKNKKKNKNNKKKKKNNNNNKKKNKNEFHLRDEFHLFFAWLFLCALWGCSIGPVIALISVVLSDLFGTKALHCGFGSWQRAVVILMSRGFGPVPWLLTHWCGSRQPAGHSTFKRGTQRRRALVLTPQCHTPSYTGRHWLLVSHFPYEKLPFWWYTAIF